MSFNDDLIANEVSLKLLRDRIKLLPPELQTVAQLTVELVNLQDRHKQLLVAIRNEEQGCLRRESIAKDIHDNTAHWEQEAIDREVAERLERELQEKIIVDREIMANLDNTEAKRRAKF